MAHIRGVICSLHKGTVQMGEDLCAGAESHRRADVIAARLAEGALAAGKTDFQRDAVADFESCDVFSDGCDGAGGFVAETHWFAHDEVAIPAVGVVVEVGAAEACCLHGDLDVGACGSWDRACFLWLLVWVCIDCVVGELTKRRSFAPWRTRAVADVSVAIMDRLIEKPKVNVRR